MERLNVESCTQLYSSKYLVFYRQTIDNFSRNSARYRGSTTCICSFKRTVVSVFQIFHRCTEQFYLFLCIFRCFSKNLCVSCLYLYVVPCIFRDLNWIPVWVPCIVLRRVSVSCTLTPSMEISILAYEFIDNFVTKFHHYCSLTLEPPKWSKWPSEYFCYFYRYKTVYFLKTRVILREIHKWKQAYPIES